MMDSMRLKDGTEVGLPGGLIGLDAEGQLWASQVEEPDALADEDLEGFLGGRAARVGQAMAYQAERVAALAGGMHPDVIRDPAVYWRGGQVIVPAEQVGQVQLRLDVPNGVLAIGPELDVWRPPGRLLWSLTQASPYTGPQAVELAKEAARRWHAFVEEQLRDWCPPMAAPRNPPRVPGDHPVA